jgi:hypothetical protein
MTTISTTDFVVLLLKTLWPLLIFTVIAIYLIIKDAGRADDE